MKKILYALTCVLSLFQIICMLFGKYIISELGYLILLSGLIVFAVTCFFIVVIVKSIKNIKIADIIILALNIEYLVYYIYFLKFISRQ